MSQLSLLGEPAQRAKDSQWFTPMHLAMRAAAWVPHAPAGHRVLEPSCGSGNLIDALIRCGHAPENIVAVELDPKWADFARERFEGRVEIVCGSFLEARLRESLGPISAALSNPPYEDELHAEFVRKMLEITPCIAGIFPQSIEFGLDRDRDLWSLAYVVRRAIIPGRVKYGGDNQASFDSVGLKIQRRTEPRRLDEVLHPAIEVWRRSA